MRSEQKKDARTWLVTGASSGIGRAIALRALEDGFRVLGTTRDVGRARSSCPEFSAKGGTWLALDPAKSSAYDEFATCCREHDVDVLVNSAAYAFIGGIEDTSEDELRDQMEVNFYGPVRTVKACLPVMRAKRSGDIVLISSGAGFRARPGRSAYAASKWAVEAIHESLSAEVESFGIRVLIVEPGFFRTPFVNMVRNPARYADGDGISEAYRGTVVEKMVSLTRGSSSIPANAGDPDKAARLIIDAVVHGHDYLRMPLGSDCVASLEEKIGFLQRDVEATRTMAESTDGLV